jgi:hypothetical protein
MLTIRCDDRGDSKIKQGDDFHKKWLIDKGIYYNNERADTHRGKEENLG